ncbi:MAG: sulfotransferase family 2 domain-containing protein [Desulfovibrionaceae bacterium]|nr:sulfotransferase family 2 domain-containing protein [Desulfovibrionaceae bacterium]
MASPLFFLHIPKTAGTTLNAVLDANFALDAVLDLYTEEQYRAVRDLTYDRLREYVLVRGHIFVRDFGEIFDGPVPLRAFTFLRDPVLRVISEYFYLKRWLKSHLHKYLNENKVTLTDYVTSDVGVLRRRGCGGADATA